MAMILIYFVNGKRELKCKTKDDQIVKEYYV